MENDSAKQSADLERVLLEFEKATKEALGFSRTVRYEGIAFDVSHRFVIADMSPLAFFHLVEPIGEDGPQEAIERLYDRLMPLLTCTHKWALLRRATDKPLQTMASKLLFKGSAPYICQSCTAYAFGGPANALPVIGKKFA